MPLASDTVAITGVSGAVETVILKDASPLEVAGDLISAEGFFVGDPERGSARLSAETPVATGVSDAPREKILLANHIDIAGRSLEVVSVDNTAVDSGNHVNKYNGKFLYGHNSAGVFGVLYGVNEGDTFSLTENGVTRSYRVQAVVIYEKIDDYTLSLNGQKIKMSVVAKARYSGVNYDLSLMTCYGTSYGNGDASHRLVLFASAI